MSASACALTGFISWGLALLILMEVTRTYLVISGKVADDGPLCSGWPAPTPTALKGFQSSKP